MQIGIFSSETPSTNSGLGRLVRILAAGMARRGHKVSLVHSDRELTELKFGLRTPENGSDGGYDVVNIHGPSAFFSDLSLLSNFARGRKIIYTYHSNPIWLSSALSRAYTTVHRLAAGRLSKFVVTHSLDYMRLFPTAKARLVHIPATLIEHRGPGELGKPDRFTILFVGQLRPYKGIFVIPGLARRLRDYDFVVIGDGYLQGTLMRKVRGIPNIHVLGSLSDEELVGWYKRSHVVLLPSCNSSEAFGLSLLEGSLFGCVPIASDLPGVRENICHLGGYTYPAGRIEALFSLLKGLGQSPKLLRERASQSRNRALAYAVIYSQESYLDQYERIFRDAVNHT